MSKPRNALNVTEQERERIRELYLDGVRVEDIIRRTGRSESIVYRAVKGLKRPKAWPRAWTTKRNDLIIKRVVHDGMTMAAVARRFHLTPTMVCTIVREALGLREKKRPPENRLKKRQKLQALVEKQRKARSRRPPETAAPPRLSLTREQMAARNLKIARLVLEQGVALAVVARRYSLSTARVRQIALRRAGSTRGSETQSCRASWILVQHWLRHRALESVGQLAH